MDRHDVLYMGLRRINGKMAVMFCPVVGGVAVQSCYTIFNKPKAIFNKPKASLISGLHVGWVYSLECELNAASGEIVSVNFGSHNALRQYHDKGTVDELMVLERAAKAEEDMAKKAKDENLTKRIDELVRPLKRAIDKTNPAGRAAIIALIMQRLMR